MLHKHLPTPVKRICRKAQITQETKIRRKLKAA